MQYRYDKYGHPVSSLAYGCMRFTKKGGKIDMAKAEAEIMEAVRLGINYFDTAYIYGGSEAAIGEIFEKNNCREQIYIADKLPHYLIKSQAGLEKTFKEQLKRLRTDYIDYYLMHMLTDIRTWERLKALGIEDWIQGKKEKGQIRQIGFSYHGNTAQFCDLLDAYPWDFCMIQYNYLDENSQAGRKGLQYAAKKRIPVMIMEPLRGGKLVELLPEKAKQMVADHYTHRTAAEWSFRWLWDQPEITAVLSGMNSIEMIRENCRIASEMSPGSFLKEDFAFIESIKKEINQSMKVGCTGCGYCMPCPKGVDIPMAFSSYNRIYSEGKGAARKGYMQCTLMRHNPTSASLCVECGKCEQHCPQGIPIRAELKKAAGELETVRYKVFGKIIRTFKMW
ncbi:MAG TPA: aldo/keto reductase [Candidatus Eubacterium avistercoris]|uniref:Aldo/keto reductase n=1 Tax=Candidatus Eubacterium avistercoris TaxID=2838567 RepID=A0A9D2IGR9_9FIRM|nr:aldo/keto reductase [Candidatus Eubacterium avistercoris]